MKLKSLFTYIALLLLCFNTAIYAQITIDDDPDDVGYYDDLNTDLPKNRAERVISFYSDLSLDKDNYMEVTEYIRIYATGNVFKRGLRRVIPQKRTDQHGHTKSMPIYPQAILCNDEESPWHSEVDEDGNLVIYIGDANTFLREGEYEYVINYIAPGHIAQFDDHDEIYWNLNGFDWDVPFDTLAASVLVPKNTKVKKFYGFTGAQGEKGKDYEAENEGDSLVYFSGTKTFSGGENMTVVVEFSKGSQKALTWWQIWQDDIYAVLLALAFLLFCVFTWMAKGIDPKKPTVIPQYTVPHNISPALAAKIMYAGEEKQVIATLMSLLVKGGATITRITNDDYEIAQGTGKGLDSYDICVQNKLFTSKDKVRTESDYEKIAAVKTALSKKVTDNYDGKIYIHNAGYLTLATVLGFAGLFFLFNLDPIDEVFFGVLALSIVVYIWYVCVIGKYTLKGIQARTDIEGLKMYITTAEELRMREMTPEHFEDLLPYAVAFGVENKWCKQFENVLKSCDYQPTWYNSSSAAYTYSSLLNNGGMSSITKGFTNATQGSFAAYDRAHSSSSGGSWSGGGGGFSGGGGGGGGGGGW